MISFKIIKCHSCFNEKRDNEFFKTRKEGNLLNLMTICKDCFIELCNKYKDNVWELSEKVFKPEDIPFIRKFWEDSNFDVNQYLKIINLPQYKDLKWSDSSYLETDTTNTDSSIKDFSYPRSIIQVLKNELIQLEGKIIKARKTENWGTYKNLILAYKEVFMLIENTFNTHQLTLEQIDRLITE